MSTLQLHSHAQSDVGDDSKFVLGYIRVSTDEQRDSGAGLQAQKAAIMAECERRGWHLVEVIEDAGYSAKDLKRPGIQIALDLLRRGDANTLVVAKLDRLSRSMLDFASIMATAQKQSWALLALDVNVDTSTPSGEAMANLLAVFAQFERRLISQRTKDALAVKKAQGVRLGRPRQLPEDVVRLVLQRRGEGLTLQQVADHMNKQEIPTAQGGKAWYASTVSAVLKSAQLDNLS